MRDLWLSLPATTQDLLLTLALLLPAGLVGVLTLRGFAAGGLIRAMLIRFRGANAIFVALIALSVALGVGLTAQERALRQGSARAADKFDLVIASPGSEITLMLAAVYLQPTDVPLLTGAQFAEVATAPGVALAAPIGFGDSIMGAPVVGTTAEFVSHLAGPLAEGRLFAASSEAVAGAFVPFAVGDSFSPVHGMEADDDAGAGAGAEHDHDHDHDVTYTITGRMAPTGSPWDRAVLVPIEDVWEIHGLANGHAPEAGARIGPPFDAAYFPGTPAIIVKAQNLGATYALQSQFSRSDMMAFFPGTVLAQLHGLMGDIRAAMSLMAGVTQVLVTIAILSGMTILVRVFARSLALLRAIGAPSRFVFAVVWGYAACLIACGALIGLALGGLAAWGLSAIITARTDIALTASLGWSEVHLVAGFVSLTLVLALVPALVAIRRPLVPDLRA